MDLDIAQLVRSLPQTREEAVDHVLAKLPESLVRELAHLPEEELSDLHFGLGMGIRNELLLWHNHALLKDCGHSHADDASSVIVEAVWRRARRLHQEEEGPASEAR